MISMDRLFLRVNNDLSKLNKSGYTSNDEFNRDVNQAQSVIMNYYHQLYEQTKHISDAVLPFKKEAAIAATNGRGDLPSDCRHVLTVHTVYTKSGCGTEVAIQKVVPMTRIKSGQGGIIRSGGIYEADLSLGIAWHDLLPGTLILYPESVKSATVTYLKNPVDGQRAVTPSGDTDVYDAANTTDLEWPDQEVGNFVNLLLYYKGISVKETALISFAQGQANTLQNII